MIKKWLKGLKRKPKQRFDKDDLSAGQILGPAEHRINTKSINRDAVGVLKKLTAKGYDAYFVGGSVRDLMLSRHPKDYDIATNATPEQVREIFRRSRIIGRRFKLVHVYLRGQDPLEISTFRASVDKTKSRHQHSEQGVLLSDNVYGSLQEDAWRRDFTVNAFYYDAINNEVLDIVGGLDDLREGVIRTIGEAKERLREDPIRVMRALRFTAKLNFKLDKELSKEVKRSYDLLAHVPGSRLYDAFVQVFFVGYAKDMYITLKKYGYFKLLFAESAELFAKKDHALEFKLFQHALEMTDKRHAAGKSLNPGFLIGIILWPALQNHLKKYLDDGEKFFHALHHANADVLDGHSASVLVLPARIVVMLRDMWLLQYYLQQRRVKRIEWLAGHRYFRAAYDMLEMRVQCGEPLQDCYQWWRSYQTRDDKGKEKMIAQLDQNQRRHGKQGSKKHAGKRSHQQDNTHD